MEKNIEKLQELLGYTFKNPELLHTALTHTSYSNEMKSRGAECESNERLEFLGDSVLSLITSEYIYQEFPGKSEGQLSHMRMSVVDGRSEAAYAQELHVGEYIFVGNGGIELSENNHPKLLEDAFEAIVAAIYIDGGYESARLFALPFIIKRIETSQNPEKNDPKTFLQELVQQGSPEERLEYVVISESGPDHNKVFEIVCLLNSNVIGRGVGRSKKEASKNAAINALELFGIEKIKGLKKK